LARFQRAQVEAAVLVEQPGFGDSHPASAQPLRRGHRQGAGARQATPIERLRGLERTDPAPRAPGARGDEPLTLSFYAIDDYLTCPLRYKYAHVLRVPLAPHHSIIYGAALHAAVSEFHKRHARGDVMREEQLFAAFERVWSSDGFLSREHEEARLAAGRDALRRFREEQLAPGAVIPATWSGSSASCSTAIVCAAGSIASTSSRGGR